MCEKCEAIDKRIGHYREMAAHLTDALTLEGIGILIAKLEADKKALHTEQHAGGVWPKAPPMEAFPTARHSGAPRSQITHSRR
jgi:hypothetical protein